jgi:hypothetical protein
MFTQLHGGKSLHGVHMIGSGNDNGVYILMLFIEHFAIIAIIRRFGPLLTCIHGHAVVNIAKGGYIFSAIVVCVG